MQIENWYYFFSVKSWSDGMCEKYRAVFDPCIFLAIQALVPGVGGEKDWLRNGRTTLQGLAAFSFVSLFAFSF